MAEIAGVVLLSKDENAVTTLTVECNREDVKMHACEQGEVVNIGNVFFPVDWFASIQVCNQRMFKQIKKRMQAVKA